MFNLLNREKVNSMKNNLCTNKIKFTWLNTSALNHNYRVICHNTKNIFVLPYVGFLFKLHYFRIYAPIKMKYSYIISEFIFDRRFIYSALCIISNKSRSRRTKRFVYQHFSKYNNEISLVNYKGNYGITAQQSTIRLLLSAEYFNTIWYLFWYPDWVSSKDKREKLPSRGKNKFQKWFFNLLYISKKKPITYVLKKLKKNKKKPIVFKNHFNVGFQYGFIGLNYRYLLTRRGVL